MKKMIRVGILIAYMFLMIGTVVYAEDSESVTQIRTSVGKIVNAVSYFGYATAMAMLVFVGIKYAMSPANEKADVKQASVNYLIGAFLIICASTVANAFVEIAAGEGATDDGLANDIISAAQTAAGVSNAGGGDGGGDGGDAGGDAGGGGGGR